MTNVSAAVHPFVFQLTRSILTVSGEWVELTRLNNVQVMEAATCLPPATQEGHNSTQSPHNLLIEPDYAKHV